ncbi:MarR family transcriptional regulator [Flavicella sp.]|uniref:MarR family winged helix-turn-helix transcriptional regulator n=1 Tax=Flavicella sp. TaxID=2957742 RepID=UPI00261033FF|nr:MarR family transcriptional regulator [Flavicella sp.]MDG1805565.1 MarR family transcriptional regulator [Flavicella sp.]
MPTKNKSIDHHLRATWQAVAKMYNEEAATYGSTMATGFLLLNIDFEKGTPSTALGPKMGMEPTSLSRLIKKMEEKGLIYREKNPDDGRGVLIKLTDFGIEKRETSKQSVLQFNDMVKDNVSDTKLQHFFEVTETIQELVSKKLIFNTKQ